MSMTKYLLRRLLHGLISVFFVVVIVMILVFTLMNRDLIFASDPLFTKKSYNDQEEYKYSQWQKYGYLDYVTYADYLNALARDGAITEEVRAEAVQFGRKPSKDSELVAKYVEEFKQYYEAKGYTVVRLDAVMRNSYQLANGGRQRYFAYKNKSVFSRVWTYFSGLIKIDNIHHVEEDIGERKLTFTLFDPIYGGDKFSPAIIGNGTAHKYLLYCDSNFPFVHQNLVTIRLGTSFAVNRNVDVFDTMTQSQGGFVKKSVLYPTGLVDESADDLHSATYVAGSRDLLQLNRDRFVDDYTNVTTYKQNRSRLGYSFLIGIISVLASYLIGIPLGIIAARKKDKLFDKIGTVYVVFILAVPSLAYIFLFKAIGGAMGLPTRMVMDSENALMYILPIVSLALPSIAGLMKWIRRYMIDQMNSDYVKFARSGGLSEREIFSKHILKNAIIPIVHGIPGSIFGALSGAIITERVYAVPGVGNLLTTAINTYDNSVIVGLTLFYALLSVLSIILGDILMSMVDPRISFSKKAR